MNYGDNVVTIQNQANGRSSVVLASPIVYPPSGWAIRNEPTVVELNSVGGKYQLSDVKIREVGVSFPGANANRPYATNASANSEGTVTIAATLR